MVKVPNRTVKVPNGTLKGSNKTLRGANRTLDSRTHHLLTLPRSFVPLNGLFHSLFQCFLLYFTRYLLPQTSEQLGNTTIRLPSSRAFFRAFKCPICTIFKVSSSHIYTWVEFSSTEYLAWLLRLQACYRQADTTVRFPSLRAFVWAIKRPIWAV